MLNITIRTIPHDKQRYPTVGDWFPNDNGVDVFRISALGNNDHEFLVAVHELIECFLCRKMGITASMVDDWDMGQGKDLDDPGAHPDAPYHKQHMLALKIEKMLARELGVDWKKYENKLIEICQ